MSTATATVRPVSRWLSWLKRSAREERKPPLALLPIDNVTELYILASALSDYSHRHPPTVANHSLTGMAIANLKRKIAVLEQL